MSLFDTILDSFDESDFGAISTSYASAGGSGVAVNGFVFDVDHSVADGERGQEQITQFTIVYDKSTFDAAIPAGPAAGDFVTINGVVYRVFRFVQDDTSYSVYVYLQASDDRLVDSQDWPQK